MGTETNCHYDKTSKESGKLENFNATVWNGLFRKVTKFLWEEERFDWDVLK